MDFSFIVRKNADPYPFNADQEAWIKELETTERKKGRGYLEDSNNQFCCLGVACVMFGAEREQSNIGARAFKFRMSPEGLFDQQLLPMPLAYRLKLRGIEGVFRDAIRINGVEFRALVGLNDHQEFINNEWRDAFTFKDIAAYMRYDPWNVFVSEEEAKKNYAGLPLS